MSPRQVPAPLTTEDWEIWTSRWVDGRDVRRMFCYMRDDRRDADLMYRLTKTGADAEAYLMLSNEPFKATVHSLLESGVEL